MTQRRQRLRYGNSARSRKFALELLEGRLLLAADFGDAPAPYPVLLSQDGARHEAIGPLLGRNRDVELDGAVSVSADGDGADEDGVTFASLHVGMQNAIVVVHVENADPVAKLDAWIDFNGDGSFAGAGERIVSNLVVANGDQEIGFDVPADSVSGIPLVARFRISSAGGLGPSGAADDGEVEDHLVVIAPPSGNGAFEEGGQELGTASDENYQVELGDLDGDGDVDVVLGTSVAGHHLWVNQGGAQSGEWGMFAPSSQFANAFAQLHAVADLDGDGDLDIVAREQLDVNSRIWINQGGIQEGAEGTFIASPGNLGDMAADIEVGDLDGDGDLDVFKVSGNGHEVWMNQGRAQGGVEGAFVESGGELDGEFADVVLGDLDGDGDLDAFAVTQNSYYSQHRIWWNQGGRQAGTTGTFVSGSQEFAEFDSLSIELGDVDGDGDLDALIGNRFTHSALYLNQGGIQGGSLGMFADSGQQLSSSVIDVGFGDVDGDGDLDAILIEFDAFLGEPRPPHIWINMGGAQDGAAGTFSESPHDLGGIKARAVAVGELDDVPGLDLFFAALGPNRIWFNSPPANLSPEANSDTALVAEDSEVSIDVLANDSPGLGEAGQFLRVLSASAVQGTVTVAVDGTIAYAPPLQYVGSDQITYVIQDDHTDGLPNPKTAVGTVDVTVTEVNDSPVANSDSAVLIQTVPLRINVLANDTVGPVNESGTQALTVIGASALHGSVTINSNGTLDYSPNVSFEYADTITYEITDNGTTAGALDAKSATATVLITSLTAFLSNGVLVVNASDFTRRITVRQIEGMIQVDGLNARFDAGLVSKVVIHGSRFQDNTITIVDADAVHEPIHAWFQVHGSGGDDTITLPTTQFMGGTVPPGRNEVYAGGGDDRIYGSNLDDYIDVTSGWNVVFGNAGNDEIRGGSYIDELHGGPGNDRIHGGFEICTCSADLLYGDEGDDEIDGGGGPYNEIHGGAGDDVIRAVGDLNSERFYRPGDTLEPHYSSLNGGAGNDVIYGADFGSNHLHGGDDQDRLVAGHGGEQFLQGDSGNDTLQGGNGNDWLHGGEGDDQLIGADGNDTMYGWAGNDQLSGEAGSDMLWGGDGDDLLDGGLGDDELRGERDDDSILGGLGSDTMHGGDGDDVLFALDAANAANETDTNRLEGDSGNDVLVGSSGSDVIFGGTGNDVLRGGANDDSLAGGDGDDQVFGEEGNDWLAGKEGADTIDAGDGDDVIAIGAEVWHDIAWLGGGGVDLVVSITLTGDFPLALSPAIQWGIETLDSGNRRAVGSNGDDDLDFRNILLLNVPSIDAGRGNDLIHVSELSAGVSYVGGEGDDVLTGSPLADNLDGGGGDDSLRGGDGDDTLRGGEGDDLLEGGEGNDTLFGDAGNDVLTGGAGQDSLDGGHDDDWLSGDADNDHLLGAHGDDLLEGGGGSDALDGGGGQNRLFGGDGDDLLENGTIASYGQAGNDTLRFGFQLWGGDGDDILEYGDELYGEAGNDLLRDAGNGLLRGGDGNDVLIGSATSRLFGDAGNDRLSGAVLQSLEFGTLMTGGAGDDQFENGMISEQANVNFSLSESTLSGLGADTFSNIVQIELTGGAGNNAFVIDGFTGRLSLDAGAGNDSIVLDLLRPPTALSVSGGSGNDEIKVTARSVSLSDNWIYYLDLLGVARFHPISSLEKAVLYGTAASDSLGAWEYTRAIEIYGFAGDDALYGGEGNDIIDGGTGHDVLSGGGGNDKLYGQAGNDYLSGGSGNDLLEGASGDDAIHGEDGADTIDGGTGHDYLTGGGGNDKLYGQAGDDYLSGGGGNDLLEGASGDDAIHGEDGADTIDGGIGHDYLTGGGGNDKLYGQAGNDTIEDGAGDDTVQGGPDNDTVLGGDGKDRIEGGDGDDWLQGGNGADLLLGNAGKDTIIGQSGDDRLFGGQDSDILVGGEGNDVLDGAEGPASRSAFFVTGTSISGDELQGGPGDDYLTGSDGPDRLFGEDGNDYLEGWGGADNLFGGFGNDVLKGGWGDDYLAGGFGDDLLDGFTGANIQFGEAGNDQLFADGNLSYFSFGTDEATVVAIQDQGVRNDLIDYLDDFAGNSGSVDLGTLTFDRVNNLVSGSYSIKYRQNWGFGIPPLAGSYSGSFKYRWTDHEMVEATTNVTIGGQKIGSINVEELKSILINLGSDLVLIVKPDFSLAADAIDWGIVAQDLLYRATTTNNYAEQQSKFLRDNPGYPGQDVYFASQSFVNWLGPETLAKYAAALASTSGAAASYIGAEVAQYAKNEAKAIGLWLAQRGITEDLDRIAAHVMDLVAASAIGGQGDVVDPLFRGKRFSVSYRYHGGIGGSTHQAFGFLFNADVRTISASGTATNGYVADATAYFDANFNGELDENEPRTVTDSRGGFQLRVPAAFDLNSNGIFDDDEGQWIVVGGTDTSTGLPVPASLRAPGSYRVVTPLTTLVSSLVDRGMSVADSEERVEQVLGLSDVPLGTLDPIAGTLGGAVEAAKVFAAHAMVQDTVAQASAIFFGVDDTLDKTEVATRLFDELALRISNPDAVLDLSSATTTESVVRAALAATELSVPDDVLANAALVIAASNQLISGLVPQANEEYLTYLAQVKIASQGILATRIQETAAALNEPEDLVESSTGDELVALVAETAPPLVLTVPGFIVVEAADSTGSPVEFQVSAVNFLGQPVAVSCSANSGDLFPMGATTVTCEDSGHVASAAFDVVVQDTTGPVLSLPDDVVVDENGDGLAYVTLSAPAAVDAASNPVTLSCDASSGWFPVGVTTVTCTAEDSTGNTSLATYRVSVLDVNYAPTVRDFEVEIHEDLDVAVFNLVTASSATDRDVNNRLFLENISQIAGRSVEFATLGDGLLFNPQILTDLAEGQSETLKFEFTISDDSGTDNATATGVATITVAGRNDSPDLTMEANAITVEEGQTARLDGSWSDIDALDTVILTASVGVVTKAPDGTWHWSLDSVNGPSQQVVTITATDSAGASTQASFILTVDNVAPILTSVHSSHDGFCSVSPDSMVTVTGAFTDPGNDSHALTISWGDGSVEQIAVLPGSRTFVARHRYATSGFFPIAVTVTDGDGASSGSLHTRTVTKGVFVVDGTLYVIGSEGRDIVSARLVDGGSDGDGDNPRVKVIANLNLGAKDRPRRGGSEGGADVFYFDPADIDSVRIMLCDGDDHATLGGSDGGSDGDGDDWYASSTIEGNGGDDQLTGGTGSDVLLGGDGNDKLDGAGGDDILSGGDGDDRLRGGDGDDLLFGGKGKDDLEGDEGDDLLVGMGWYQEENTAALRSVFAEWTRRDVSYEKKRDHLTGIAANGLNQQWVLNELTLMEDRLEDHLSGDSDRDLFFASLGGSRKDKLKGRVNDEFVIDLW